MSYRPCQTRPASLTAPKGLRRRPPRPSPKLNIIQLFAYTCEVMNTYLNPFHHQGTRTAPLSPCSSPAPCIGKMSSPAPCIGTMSSPCSPFCSPFALLQCYSIIAWLIVAVAVHSAALTRHGCSHRHGQAVHAMHLHGCRHCSAHCCTQTGWPSLLTSMLLALQGRRRSTRCLLSSWLSSCYDSEASLVRSESWKVSEGLPSAGVNQ